MGLFKINKLVNKRIWIDNQPILLEIIGNLYVIEVEYVTPYISNNDIDKTKNNSGKTTFKWFAKISLKFIINNIIIKKKNIYLYNQYFSLKDVVFFLYSQSKAPFFHS